MEDMRDTFLPFAAPSIGEEEIAEVVETLRSGWLTTGPKVRRFEEEFAAKVAAKHAVAVNSCTAALHLALEAAGIGRDDEVITSPMTFAATGEVIHYLGAKPVFVDIDPVTMNLDSALLEDVISRCRRARAIIPVHMGGLACDMDPILAIARRHGLRVIEDAAHAFPTRYKGRMIGAIGDVTCFSFYSTKTITTGEGGMATTDDPALAARMRMMSLHGISHNAWSRYTAEGSWYYEILQPGFKYNLTDLAAALGLAQLHKADEFLKRRQAIARRYTTAFASLADFLETPPDAPAGGQHSWHLYVIKLRLNRLTIDRDQFIAELKTAHIGVSVHFIPLHIHPYYRDTYGYRPEGFPHAHEVYERIISLPIYPAMTDADADSVIDAIGDLCRAHAR
ncbi:MAG: DegT/DnrJ/EryC1/StrS aminotransferase family protein [Candidatus Zixiibacteriota bacterium]